MYDALRSLSSHMTGRNTRYKNEEAVSSDNIQEEPFALLNLPSEILDLVLSFLSPVSLCHTSSTCKTLSKHANSDLLWRRFLHHIIPSPAPYQTWKSLYAAHYPYWFLPEHKLFFSDKATLGNALQGQLILIRYDPRTGNIEGYRLVAEQPPMDSFLHWPHNPDVIISEFNPKVSLFLDDPIVKLEPSSYEPGNRLKQEILLTRGQQTVRSRLFPAIRIPTALQAPSMYLWPPATIPVSDRVRNDSATLFVDDSAKPSDAETHMSTTAFRTRKWVVFGGMSERLGMKMGEDVMTWATLPGHCYKPTARKPYQGIWVGDYNGHGCEFLVVIQRSPDEAAGMMPVQTMPERWMLGRAGVNALDGLTIEAWLGLYGQGGGAQGGEDETETAEEEDEEGEVGDQDGMEGIEDTSNFAPTTPELGPSSEEEWERENPGEVGRLDAIKLTGDENIPRGEPSWIAEDIGRGGLLRVADERMFRGARVVKSAGHIAARGFASGE